MAMMATCYMCHESTKCSYISCKVPVYNVCCSPEMDEDTADRASATSVGYCDSCSLSTKEWSDGQEQQYERQNCKNKVYGVPPCSLPGGTP